MAYEDSEWIVLPNSGDNWRDTWWVTGNHGNYVLNENTLESDVIGVDFASKKLTVPWGIQRLDDIMHYMKKKPGIAWYYTLNGNTQDSLYRSARTGDKLEIIVCGAEKQSAIFDIVVSPPTADANIVVPMAHRNISLNPAAPIVTGIQNGVLDWPRVTRHTQGQDTITGSDKGVPYALRTDSLLKYLEKPANATWEIVWVDGVKRPDIKYGDKLKVIAQNGNIKEYFIEVRAYEPSKSSLLSAITWPDIPEFYKGFYGWKGDTIPDFSMSVTDYKINVPIDVDGIPALVAIPYTLNSKVEVTRATSLTGAPSDRTIKFKVTAEDGVTTTTYNIELIKEIDPDKVQPFYGEPFLSEYIRFDLYYNH